MSSILLQHGTALIHDEHGHVEALKSDVLITGNKIVKIEANIVADALTEVVDCTNKIICPGFIDTHHHVWQTQLKVGLFTMHIIT
jgi:cytosine/adenosine deaminase-related metal-dependent hydrolase